MGRGWKTLKLSGSLFEDCKCDMWLPIVSRLCRVDNSIVSMWRLNHIRRVQTTNAECRVAAECHEGEETQLLCLLLLWMWRNWLLAAGCGCSGLFSGLLRVSAQLPGHVEHCFPAMPGAGSRFVGTLDTNLLLFVNIKTFQLDENKINVNETYKI